MSETILEPKTEQRKQNNGNYDSTFELLKENFEKAGGKMEQPASVKPVITEPVDLTASFQEKFTPLQKEGKIEDINKLRVEVQEAIKSGKKVSNEFISQLELSAETPEQRQIRELSVQKETIQNDLKLSEIEKTEALKKLDGIKEKNYWEDPNFDNPVAKVEKQVENKDESFKLLELKAKQLEEIESDNFVKAYLSAKKSGKPVDAFLTEISTGNPNSLTDEQILEKRIARFGLAEDEATEERDAFKAMSPTNRKEIISKERSLLNQEYQKNFEKYSTSNAQEQERTLSIAKQAIKEKNDYLAKIQNKEVWGITYDSTQIQKLEEWADNVMQNGLFKEDGSWDIPKIMQLGMKALNTQHMLQKAFEKGETSANEQWYKKYGRPSVNNGLAKAPDVSLLKGRESDFSAYENEWRRKNNFSEVVQKQN